MSKYIKIDNNELSKEEFVARYSQYVQESKSWTLYIKWDIPTFINDTTASRDWETMSFSDLAEDIDKEERA